MPEDDSLKASQDTQASNSDQPNQPLSELLSDSSDEDTEAEGYMYAQIINYVKDVPVLWQRSHQGYGRHSVLNTVWKKMSQDLNVDDYILKRKWKHIKDQYKKVYKKLLKFPSAEITWPHYKNLGFLHDLTHYSVEKCNSDIEKSSSSTWTRKSEDCTNNLRNLNKTLDVRYQSDSNYMYLMSVLPQVKAMTEMQKLDFRVKVHDWLLELSMQNQFLDK